MRTITRITALVNAFAGIVCLVTGALTWIYGQNHDAWLMIVAGVALLGTAWVATHLEYRRMP